MSQYFVQGSVDRLILGYQNDGPAARRECRTDVAESRQIVLHVLDDVEADHGIELALEVREVFRAAEVAAADLQIGPPAKTHALAGEVLVVDIGGYVVLAAAGELLGHVTDAGAEFQHPLAEVGTDGVGHPPVEAFRAGERIQNVRAGIAVDVAGEVAAYDHPQRADGVFGADFLAFLVGAAVIADGDLVDGGLPFGELDGDFGLDAEAVAPDGN